ncbi:MAG TPA: serine hydrolase domain-containing protein [Gammaproteobacteria bacterium]
MRTNVAVTRTLALGFVAAMLAGAAVAETAAPEDVGLSSERLERIGELVDRHIEAGDIAGAVDEFLRERVFGPLGMTDTTFWPTAAQRERLASSYVSRDGELVPRPNPDSMSGERYFSAAGGLMTTAEDYARFAMMLANDGELDGVRILSPRSVEMMRSIFVPDTLPGRQPGEAFGLGVRVIENPAERRTWLSEGSFGWSGAYGTHFWVSPRERLVAILLAQTSVRPLLDDFETAVMQAVVD